MRSRIAALTAVNIFEFFSSGAGRLSWAEASIKRPRRLARRRSWCLAGSVLIGALRRWMQGRGDSVIGLLKPDKMDMLARRLRHVFEVLPVARRQKHGRDTRAH